MKRLTSALNSGPCSSARYFQYANADRSRAISTSSFVAFISSVDRSEMMRFLCGFFKKWNELPISSRSIAFDFHSFFKLAKVGSLMASPSNRLTTASTHFCNSSSSSTSIRFLKKAWRPAQVSVRISRCAEVMSGNNPISESTESRVCLPKPIKRNVPCLVLEWWRTTSVALCFRWRCRCNACALCSDLRQLNLAHYLRRLAYMHWFF
mmetsp:Transcript_13375/g.49687  ORF Transcript_13375/g.49687 Transcript_13375/m.49687 type:complete len:208 (+) Transcript_13375:3749-4372(+)